MVELAIVLMRSKLEIRYFISLGKDGYNLIVDHYLIDMQLMSGRKHVFKLLQIELERVDSLGFKSSRTVTGPIHISPRGTLCLQVSVLSLIYA